MLSLNILAFILTDLQNMIHNFRRLMGPKTRTTEKYIFFLSGFVSFLVRFSCNFRRLEDFSSPQMTQNQQYFTIFRGMFRMEML